ncbi:flagellar hook-length control protein FliK [Pseudomonas syringae]|nr:flagellar hook-length control protein FliK [Pseudomonas syringae]MBD8788931.1 flagellar hook-length control protein FliK [Pseudomonas syringae]MBD8800625.1 flagellar hook-length control protein FliK [Pseudomonas syringae]MBD8812543.1 flagellar hook-length control protein FliK [Pseudomonas syringae]
MSLAPNVLLQTHAATTAKSSAASQLSRSAEIGKDPASGFAKVFNRESREAPKAERDVQPNAAREKGASDKPRATAGKDKPSEAPEVADNSPAVAESGNDLPADAVAQAAEQPQSGEPGADGDTQNGTASTPEQADQALAGAQAGQGALPLIVQTAPTPIAAVTEEAFNPDVDPLDGLHALQFALESANGRRAGTAASPTQTPTAQNGALVDGEVADAQNIVNNLASLQGDQDLDGADEGSEKSLAGLLDDGLKDVKAAAGDTRVDNFAERLAALSQAAQPARVGSATPVSTPVINQPLAMHQSGWSEGIVERVMYLSSQNLKSAEIKLEPAELGRLDIRVNMAPDQQTQVTFVSAHLGVRDALESQMIRLRESFQQQGLGQVDVNVSDQSQQQAQQQAQEQASRAQRGGSRIDSGNGDALEGHAAEPTVAASQPVERVIGSSEIDYYA